MCGDAIKWLSVSEYLFNREVKSKLAMIFPSPLKHQVAGTKHRKELLHYWKYDILDGKRVSLYRHVDPISVQVSVLDMLKVLAIMMDGEQIASCKFKDDVERADWFNEIYLKQKSNVPVHFAPSHRNSKVNTSVHPGDKRPVG